MADLSLSTRRRQVPTGCHSPTLSFENVRLDLLTEYRRRRGEVFRANRAAQDAANAASIVEEWAGEAEGRLLRELRRNGPIVSDGRHYSAVKRHGVYCVDVRADTGSEL